MSERIDSRAEMAGIPDDVGPRKPVMSEQWTWEPVEDQVNAILAAANHVLWQGHPDVGTRLCRRVPAQGVPVNLLKAMTARIIFAWHYEMGKVGYECPYCRALQRNQSDIWLPENHSDACVWAQATKWLDAQQPQPGQAQEGE